MIVSASPCPVFAVTGHFLLEAGEEFGLLLAIISADAGTVRAWNFPLATGAHRKLLVRW